jgi:ABC-type multidrug transport system fused ATPase/permease subunit
MGIVIKDLCFRYGGAHILDRINLRVARGEHVGIVGPSGGGKSTLLKLVSGLYEAREGEVTVMGARTACGRRKNVAMVMQSAALFPASIRDNLTCGHGMGEDALRAACRAAQLEEWIAGLPEGLETFVGERGGQVSGGQAQRICIARAILKGAPVILLDEPTSALDGGTSAGVIAALGELTAGKTVLHVSHRMETLAGCGRVLRLEGGRLHDL